MAKRGKSCVLHERKHPHHRVADSGDSAYVRKRAGVLATGQMTAWSGFECHGMPGFFWWRGAVTQAAAWDAGPIGRRSRGSGPKSRCASPKAVYCMNTEEASIACLLELR
jgi:hypothetical protein